MVTNGIQNDFSDTGTLNQTFMRHLQTGAVTRGWMHLPNRAFFHRWAQFNTFHLTVLVLDQTKRRANAPCFGFRNICRSPSTLCNTVLLLVMRAIAA